MRAGRYRWGAAGTIGDHKPIARMKQQGITARLNSALMALAAVARTSKAKAAIFLSLGRVPIHSTHPS
jgi:hypothetical protein